MITTDKKELVRFFLERKILVSKETIDALASTGMDLQEFYTYVKPLLGEPPALSLKHISSYHASTQRTSSLNDSNGTVKVTHSYPELSRKWEVQDVVAYLNQRYMAIEKLLRQRAELQNLLPISRIKAKKEKDTVSLIAMVSDKQITKNRNMLLTV